MSVPVPLRKKSKLDVQVKAEDLAKYTIEITSNQRKFDPRYAVITERIVDTVLGIGMDIWEANNIRVGVNPQRYEERRDLQERAIRGCNLLLYLITLSKRVYHLTSKRVEYWTEKTVDVKDLIRKWRESDAKRYASLRDS